jgi:DNA-binding SARP family transcriptional activator
MRAERLRLVTYGGFSLIRRRTAEPMPLRGRKAAGLCAYLVLTGGTADRETLRSLLWGSVSPRAGRHSLSQTISGLRVQLSLAHDRPVITSYGSVTLAPQFIRADVHAVERLLRRRTSAALRLACRMSSGEFLSGLNLREPSFDMWVARQRAYARDLAYKAHWLGTSDVMRYGRTVDALLYTLRLVEINPLDDRGHLLLMTLYAEQGQVAAALRQYDTCARLLEVALQPKPRPEMEELRQRLLGSPHASFKPARDVAADFAPRQQKRK